MGDRNDLNSPIKRARGSLIVWFDLLPEEARLDAVMALDSFCQTVEREVQQAYFDGHNQRSAAVAMRKIADAPPKQS